MTRRGAALLACTLGAVLTCGTPARVRAQGPEPLTALDYFEIHNLISRYAHGFDSGARGGAMYADVFTDDGAFADGTGRVIEGRDAIAQLGSGGPNSRKGPTNAGHFITNIVVEPTADGARARSYVMIGGGPGRRGGGAPQAGGTAPAAGPSPAPRPSFGMGGQYWDTLVRTPAGWRIRARALIRAGSTTETPSIPGPAPTPAGAASPSTLTAEDYRDLLALESLRNRVVANPLFIGVPGGVVAKTYGMNVESTPEGTTIGPGGIFFTVLGRTTSGWVRDREIEVASGAPAPESAAGLVAEPPAASVGTPKGSGLDAAVRSVSPEDMASIRQLYARAAMAFDSGADDGQAYARLFTDTASVQDERGETRSGHAALASWAAGDGSKTERLANHFVYTIRLTRAGDRISGQAYVIVATLGGQGRQTIVDTAGTYRDEIVRTPDGWRFASRRFTAGVP